MKKNIPITVWAIEDRPREKLLSKGIQSLSDAELIAILIGSGSKNESAVELSKRILLSVSNNLNQLGKLTIAELQSFKGIGEAKAISIVAAMELGKRRKVSEILEKKKINSSGDVFEIFVSLLGDLPYEEFWVLYRSTDYSPPPKKNNYTPPKPPRKATSTSPPPSYNRKGMDYYRFCMI